MHVLWTPVGRLVDAGLLRAIAYLLSTQEYRDVALDILRELSARKQNQVCMCNALG